MSVAECRVDVTLDDCNTCVEQKGCYRTGDSCDSCGFKNKLFIEYWVPGFIRGIHGVTRVNDTRVLISSRRMYDLRSIV